MEKKLFVQFPEEGTETDGSKQKSSDGEQYKNSEVFLWSVMPVLLIHLEIIFPQILWRYIGGNGCFACINSGIRGSTPAVG